LVMSPNPPTLASFIAFITDVSMLMSRTRSSIDDAEEATDEATEATEATEVPSLSLSLSL
jgi:hypothetical protein